MDNSHRIVSRSPAIVWAHPRVIAHRIDAHPFQPYLVEIDELLAQRPDCVTLGQKLRRRRGMSGGATPRGANYLSEGIRFIRTEDVTPNWIDLSQVVHISIEDHRKLERSSLEEDDVLLTITGALFGQSATVYSGCLPANISQHSVRMHFADDVDPRYVSTYLNSKYGQAQIQKHKVGATRSAIDYTGVKALKVPLPPRPVQEYIGAEVRLAERCRARARELYTEVQRTLDQIYKGAPTELTQMLDFWVEPAEFDSPRLDSWHYQPVYRRLVQWCRKCEFVPASSIASLAQRKWSPKRTRQLAFHYIEISDIDVSTGHVSGKELSTAEAPGRARKLVRAYDVLVSTVRSNRKGVGIVPPGMDGWVASTGFSVLQATNSLQAYFLCAVLRHDVSTLQMMRWNTGATYPAIDEDVPLRVLIPNPNAQLRDKIGKDYGRSIQLLNHAICLVHEAKADVEALIEGRLDVEGIVAGQVQPPRWEDLEV